MKLYGVCLVFLVVIGAAEVAIGHPADGREPRAVSPLYGSEASGYGPEYDFAEIVFAGRMPDSEGLTDEERYVIAGIKSDGSYSLMPWAVDVFFMLDKYDKVHGTVPAVLDEPAIRSCFEDGEVDSMRLEILKSPLTGDYPRTDQLSFSPGDLYCRKLTPSEIGHVAQFESDLRSLIQNQEWLNPGSGEMESAQIGTSVFYIRVYGWNDVIYESVQYSIQPAS